MKKIEIKWPPDRDMEREFEKLCQPDMTVYHKHMRQAAIYQNRMLVESMTHHDDYNLKNYIPEFTHDYHADTGCIDIGVWFNYEPKQENIPKTEQERLNVRKMAMLCEQMKFLEDYDMEHFIFEERKDENGVIFDYRIYYRSNLR